MDLDKLWTFLGQMQMLRSSLAFGPSMLHSWLLFLLFNSLLLWSSSLVLLRLLRPQSDLVRPDRGTRTGNTSMANEMYKLQIEQSLPLKVGPLLAELDVPHKKAGIFLSEVMGLDLPASDLISSVSLALLGVWPLPPVPFSRILCQIYGRLRFA